MKRNLLKGIVFFISIFAFGQKKVNYEFSVGPTVSLFQSHDNFLRRAKEESKPNLGFYLQSNLNYKKGDLFSFDLGLGYSLNRFSINEDSPIRRDIVRKVNDLYQFNF